MKLLALAAGALVALIPVHAAASGADFVAASANPGASFSTAADFNTVAVTLSDPGTLHGTVSLAASATSDRGIAQVTFQASPAGAGTWTDACTATTSPFTCSFDTTTMADGLQDIRAVATDAAGYSRTATVSSRLDNTAPAVSLTDPGTPLSGTITLRATATDTGSGVTGVTFAAAPAGTGTYTTLCTGSSCALNTATLADGLYDLRAIATDAAGNTTTATVANRRIDNDAPTVALIDPGSPIRNTRTISATAGDPIGVASVKIQRKPSSGGAWTDVCTDSTSSYSCPLTAVADGTYDFRALATDTLGHISTSATIASRTLDSTAPAGSDIQAVNGTDTAGKIDSGDVITFSFSEAMAPASILSGWTGTSATVYVLVTAADTLSVYDSTNTTKLNLGDVALKADRTSLGARLAATMSMSGTKVTITLGAVASGATKSSSSKANMVWTPSTGATDLAGNPMAATAVTETGTMTDVDF